MSIPPLQTGQARAVSNNTTNNATGAVSAKDSAASRSTIERLSQVAGGVAETGKNLASGAAKLGAETIMEHGQQVLEHNARNMFRILVSRHLGSLILTLGAIPIAGPKMVQMIVDQVYPYFKQINPQTELTAKEIAHRFQHGQTEFLENEFFQAAEVFVKSQLSAEDKLKMEQGDKMVILKAFGSKLYEQVTSTLTVAKQPGGATSILKKIANWTPFVKSLPDSVKPVAGGAVALGILYFGFKMAMKALKWVFLIGGGIAGYKLFSGGKKHAAPEEAEKPGFLAKAGGMMEQVSKLQNAMAAAKQHAA